jgi:thiol-disulfide isomerase/thioredoxin
MKNLFFSLAFFLLTTSNAQQKSTVTKNASGDLIGLVTKVDFNQQPYATWFAKTFDSYTVDAATIKALQKKLKNTTIKAFMGTWCKDSKREVPRFYKVLEVVNFDLNNVEMITVNRGKKTPDNLQEGFDIKRVPTFIFYKNGKEIGRYVEFPRTSLEKDILTIVSGKPYKHSYEK